MYEVVRVHHRMRVGPLLELDDHVRRSSGGGVDAGEHGIDPLARERESMLDEHFDVLQTRIAHVVGEDGQARGPRAHLTGRWSIAHGEHEPLFELSRKSLLDCRLAKTLGRKPEKRHGDSPTQHEMTRAGGGVSGRSSRTRKPVGPHLLVVAP